MPGQAKVRIRYRRLATEWFDYLLLSPEELVGLLHGTPWLLTDLIQDGADYTAELTLE